MTQSDALSERKRIVMKVVENPPTDAVILDPIMPAKDAVETDLVCGRCGKILWSLPGNATFLRSGPLVWRCVCGAYNLSP